MVVYGVLLPNKGIIENTQHLQIFLYNQLWIFRFL